MSDDRALKSAGDPDASLTVVVGVVGAVLIFVVIVLVQALFQSAEQAEVARKVASEPPAELSSLRATQLEALTGYRWVDPRRGVVAIPIERAMDIVVRERH